MDATMQGMLLRLTAFWARQGCQITYPVNTEGAAGTLNPATFLRVLGPEPWRVAYTVLKHKAEPVIAYCQNWWGVSASRLPR